MSILATKRRFTDTDLPSTTPATTCHSEYQRSNKRLCHTYSASTPPPSLNIHALLNSDNRSLNLSARRLTLLQSLHFTETDITSLFTGLNSNISTFLSIIDVNLWQENVMSVVGDYATRGVPLVRLNIQGHSFSLGEKQDIIASFDSFYPSHSWPRDVVRFVANVLFRQDDRISVSIFSGGGIRDILLADWCRLHGISPSGPSPQLIVVTAAPSQRTFFVPFTPPSI